MDVWIIEQNYGYGEWKPVLCEGEIMGHLNFYTAHRMKREMVDVFWDLSKAEEKENFRIKKYSPKE